jgi:hypothetical protein
VAEILSLADDVAGQNQAVERAWQDLSGPLLELDGLGLLKAIPA